MIGVPRPKKAKVQQLEESGLDENTGITVSFLLYKGQVKMLQARLALSEAQTGAAEAAARLQEALLMREQHAHACTRCKLL